MRRNGREDEESDKKRKELKKENITNKKIGKNRKEQSEN